MAVLDRENILVDGVCESGYLYCMYCERAYKEGEYRLKPSQWSAEDAVVFREEGMSQDMIEMSLAAVKMCPYPDCAGDEWDGWPWETIRESHPEYPEIPEIGHVYPLY